jgi:hypothetical protein
MKKKTKTEDTLPVQTIVCPGGCPPDLTNITKSARTLRWIYYPEGPDSKITSVTGLPSPPFKNPKAAGNAYEITYVGDPGTERFFGYLLSSDPPCLRAAPKKRRREGDEVEEGQLTNGPG